MIQESEHCQYKSGKPFIISYKCWIWARLIPKPKSRLGPTTLEKPRKKRGPLQTWSRHDSRLTNLSGRSDTRNRVSETRRTQSLTIAPSVGINSSANHCSESDNNE
ncbi:hypothetical protein YC2023_119383 [Brassica napus]